MAAKAPGAAPAISVDNLNPKLVQAQYAVRGELVIKAEALKKQLAAKPDSHGLPFNEVIFCNIGNPQSLKQKPLTYHRQVLSLLTYPQLLNEPGAAALFPADAMERARSLLAKHPEGLGSYSHSKGLSTVREEVAQFLLERDGYPADPEDIFLTDGASAGVKMIVQAMVRNGDNDKDGVITPIPQYPLYSATLTMHGGKQIGYYLDESKGWGMSIEELTRSVDQAKKDGILPRALVVINPGNPTGQCLPVDNMKAVVEFCQRHNLVLLADEVYQTNVYGDIPFTSFKKVVCDMKLDDFPLISFHSTSKGFIGECGKRGGYFELHGFKPELAEQLYKMASVSLCSNLDGQVMMGLMVQPPKPGSPSHELYAQERDAILSSMKRRAVKLAEALNKLEGVTCNPVAGAMYAFPQITLPPKAIEAAKAAGKSPDTWYCLQLLDQAGICVVPGSGFGQVKDTWHFRTTILPPEEQMEDMFKRITVFHNNIMDKYR